jgi:hypothetical protein
MLLRFAIPIAVCTLLVSACISAVRPLADDGTTVIAGKDTAGMTRSQAASIVLTEAARITVDHDARYFRIVQQRTASGATTLAARRADAIQPGADVLIKVYANDAIRGTAAGLWDAQQILAGPAPPVAAAVAMRRAAPAAQPTAPATPQPAPRCTAYGCDW